MPDGKTVVTNAVEEEIAANAGDIASLMQRAQLQRSVGFTDMNAASSRSHAVFRLRLEGSKNDEESVSGVLNLIDLAGSERLNSSHATGNAAKVSYCLSFPFLSFPIMPPPQNRCCCHLRLLGRLLCTRGEAEGNAGNQQELICARKCFRGPRQQQCACPVPRFRANLSSPGATICTIAMTLANINLIIATTFFLCSLALAATARPSCSQISHQHRAQLVNRSAHFALQAV